MLDAISHRDPRSVSHRQKARRTAAHCSLTLDDLMKIRDPDNKARKPLNDGVLTFPFFTIENVDRVDDTHIIVGNDNNLPFSSSRDPNKADDNEFVLLEVGDFLKAK